jgi:protocatechuate 4,5-dioxygenase beta chain
MAKIVAAMAMTHAPGMTGWFDRAPERDQDVARRGTAELRRRLEAARPDVIVMLSNDHLLNWPINNVPRWTVGIGDEHVGPADWFDEWLALTKFHVKGHPALARAIVREGDRLGVSFAYLRRLEFDDGFSVPLHFLTPRMDVALVPIAMNCTVPPLPSTADTYRMGEALREIITRRWPGNERVAVVGTGGLSHEPGGPRYFVVDEKFDRWFLDLLAFGDPARVVEECTVERMEAAGSGGTAELLAWIAVLPFTAGPAEVIAYAPSVAWRTGTGFVAWPVEA